MSAPCVRGILNHMLCFSLCLALLWFLDVIGQDQEPRDDILLCRQCGHEVVESGNLATIGSKEAYRQRNDTILGKPGVLIQLFKNPEGNKFEVITATDADVFKDDKKYKEYSWFPGFSWRMCVCPRCGFHLGWFFEVVGGHKSEHNHESFFGLILANLHHMSFSESLLITPKSYTS